MTALERPAVRFRPQAVEDLELLLEHVGPLVDGWKREPVALVLALVPARADPDLDPAAAHLVDGRDDLGEVAWMPECHRRDEDAEGNVARFPSEASQDRPRVSRRTVARAREALVMVRAEER